MDKCKKIRRITWINFCQWKWNPRIAISFLLGAVLCMMLIAKVQDFVGNYHTSVQIFEPFIWVFGDPESIMISSLLLILLFADMPFVQSVTPYCLVRTGRMPWLAGQIGYVMLSTIIYTTFTMLITCLLSVQNAFPGNKWSETGAMLGYSGVGAEIALPASVKAMETTRPYQCAAMIFLLLTLYALMLAVLMMVMNLYKSQFLGILMVFGVSLYGFFLSPEVLRKILRIPEALAYKGNLAAGWLSPLNHATYYMHNFGYDRLPKIWMSVALFLILISILIALAAKKIRQYEFHFIQKHE